MKIYKFKCKDCGSRKYEKTDEHAYKCIYCGYTEEVYFDEQKPKKEQITITKIDDGATLETTQKAGSENFEKEYREHMAKVKIQQKKFTKKLIALLLCCFAGMTGIHRIFERKIFTGVLYLCTMGLFFVGWIYDILKMSFALYDISIELNVMQRSGRKKFGSGADFYG